MQEVDAQPHDALALAVHLEERDVHREVVFVRGAVRGRIGGLERALVEVRRHADERRVVHGVDDAAPPLGGSEQRLAQEEERLRALAAGKPGGDRAIVPDVHAIRPQRVPAHSVRLTRPGERDHHERRVVRYRRVELADRGEAAARRNARRRIQVIGVEAADSGNPRVAVGQPGCTRGIDLLHVLDRQRVLERRVEAGPVAHQHDVVVVVDDPRHHRAAAQVDDLRVGPVAPPRRVADLGEAPVRDRYGRDDRVLVVHRVYLAVDEHRVRRVVRRQPAAFFIGIFFLARGALQDRAARRGGCRALHEPAAREAAPLLVRGHFSSP